MSLKMSCPESEIKNPESSETYRKEVDDKYEDKLQKLSRNEACYNKNKTIIANHVRRILKNFPTPSERYYDIRLVPGGRTNYFGEVGDQCIMFHSNKVCIVTLAPSHPVIAEDKDIIGVDYKMEGDDKIDRLACKPTGKFKKGGQKLRKNAPLCIINCSGGSKYVVIASIGSRLIEVNEAITQDCNLIKTHTLSSGYIAIIQANEWKHLDKLKDNFAKLSEDTQVTLVECDD